MRRFLLKSRAPVVLLEADPGNAGALIGCAVGAFVRFMYEEAGYVVTTEEGGFAPLSLAHVLEAVEALAVDSASSQGWLLYSGHYYFQRNDTVGIEARGGRALPPFATRTAEGHWELPSSLE